MSDVKATIKSAILAGLTYRAHLTGVSALPRLAVEEIVEDILSALFKAEVRWALELYIEELES